MTSKSQRLRQLIESPEILVMPGVFNGYSARLVEQMGFAAGFVSGGGLAENLLGQPDIGLMGFGENLLLTRSLAGCTSLPLLADIDTGYGNAINARFTAQAFEQAGVAGVMIEDQSWPKRCGHLAGKSVIDADEMIGKIQAAADVRHDPDFVIMARTDAAGTHGVEEAIRRLNLYAEAGATLLFADALLTTDAITEVARRVHGPLLVNMGFGLRTRTTTPLLSARQLQRMGVAVIIYPRLVTAAAVQGMKLGLSALKEALPFEMPVERPDLVVSFEDLNELVGLDQIGEWERRYAPENQSAR